jgi:hypothetical protein
LIDKEVGHFRIIVTENSKRDAEDLSPVVLTNENYFELIKHNPATIGLKFLVNQIKDA